MVVEMIENVYPISNKGERIAGRSRRLPRNIRACGQGGGVLPVYIEDYVETYIRRLTENEFPECSAAILVGQVMETEVGRCLFVRGAVNASKICVGDRPEFEENIWSEVYEKIRLYFPHDEVVGWCVAGPGFRLLQEEQFLRAHIDNFADSEKVFGCYESLEKDLVLRICEGGSFQVLPGYYIYYEKNDEMQNYMLEEANVSRREVREEKSRIVETESCCKSDDIKQPKELSKKKVERNGSVRKDIIQLAAIACIIVLIISAMVGTNTLSELKTSLFTNNGAIGEKQALSEDGIGKEKEEVVPTDNPDGLAFADFDFLDEEKNKPTLGPVTDGKEQEAEETLYAGEGTDTVETVQDSEEEKPVQDVQNVGQKVSEEEEAQLVGEAETVMQESEDPNKIEEETVTVLAPTEYTSYIVKAGDTLAKICKEVYGSVEFLYYVCELNQLKNVDSIYIGQELVLPKK